MSKLRIGMIGAGGIANYHLKHLQAMDDVEVTGVMDIIPERAEKMAALVGAKVYADHYALYDSGIDAAFICIPPYAHTDQELLAAEKGIPFFVEKPQTLSIDLANRVAQLVEKNHVITAVGFQDRYQDIFDRLRDFMQGKPVGLFYGSWIGGMPGVHWWRRKELSGGQHIEQTIHIFDAARYFLGEVVGVSAVAASAGLMRDVENYNVEDATAVTLQFASGAIGTIFSACYLKEGRAGKSGFDIFLPDARIEYKLRRSVTYHTKDEAREDQRANDNGMLCDRTFIEAVQCSDGSKIRSPYQDAVRTLAVVLAADASLQSEGRVVGVA